MELLVGPHRYRVYLIFNLTHPQNNQPLAGGVCFENQEFHLDISVPTSRRQSVLLHEYWHAWVHHFGNPIDEETSCDHFASACLQFLNCITKQGGESDALRCLEVKIPRPRPPEVKGNRNRSHQALNAAIKNLSFSSSKPPEPLGCHDSLLREMRNPLSKNPSNGVC